MQQMTTTKCWCLALLCWCLVTCYPAAGWSTEQTVDGITCATQTWVTGNYSGFAPGEGIMSNQLVADEIVDYTGGRKDNRIWMLASSYDGYPVATPAEYTLDPATMSLYGIHETDTEKLLQIERNPRVSLSLHEEFTDFESLIKSLQVKGTPIFIDGEVPEFERILMDILPFEEEYGAYFPNLSPEALMQLLKAATVLTKITLTEATLANTSFKQRGYRTYQRWTRGVMVSGLRATPGSRRVTLGWQTEAEPDNCTGFHLYRAESGGSAVKITTNPVTATGSPNSGAVYSYTDTTVRNRATYTYTLVTVDDEATESTQAECNATPRLIYRWQR